MATLERIFSNTKLTENGDITYSSTGNHLIDLLFMTEYYSKHPGEAVIGTSDREKLFSMFIRDPRFGLGKRDLGRTLMRQAGVSIDDVVKAGRYDDIFHCFDYPEAYRFLGDRIREGDELAKKWAPRYSSKNLELARDFAHYLGMNKQQYGKFVKAKTVERSLSSKHTERIAFEHVPSLAMIKYYKRFASKEDTAERFSEYLKDVKGGKKELKVSTTSVYDIYRNRASIDPDLFFDKIEKIAINCIPIVDSSASMQDENDSYGKAMAIGHYLAKCSTYAPGKVVSFSSYPQLITLGEGADDMGIDYSDDIYAIRILRLRRRHAMDTANLTGYMREIATMYTGDCSNTDFGAVMQLLGKLDKLPEYLVVLSDMEFDRGSKMSKDEVSCLWARKGYTTKIVWWNLNSRHTTAPEIDEEGNIFMSGYNPMLLKFLDAGFDAEKFLDRLLDEYRKAVER